MNNLLKLCLLGVVLAVTAVTLFKLPISNVLFFGLILACPLMHIFMHGGHGDHAEQKTKGEHIHG